MNYLAHAVLSFGNGQILTGNMIADHVKGKKALESFPEMIQKGIHLHRFIDQFTDQHPAVKRTALLFREDYRLYSGPITDALFDHFVANDPKLFRDEAALMSFTQATYDLLEENQAHFPEMFAQYFSHMRSHNWLYGYRTLLNMKKPLESLRRRASNINDTQKAYELFVGHYYQINQAYFELMDDLVPAARLEFSRLTT